MTEVRVPPHSLEAEQSVLGSLLCDASLLTGLQLVAEDFYRPSHGQIFTAITTLAARAQPVDVVTVSEMLGARGQLEDAGGLGYLVTLHRETPSAYNAPAYARIVRNRSLQRKLIALGNRLTAEVYAAEREHGNQFDLPALAIVDDLQRQLLELQTAARVTAGLVSSADLVRDFLEDLDARKDGALGLQVGLPDFDAMTNGLEAGDLIVIAARPGMGKTALLISIADYVGKDRPVAVFSAEMPSRQLVRRNVANLANLPQGRLRRPEGLTERDWECIANTARVLAERQLFVDDTSTPTLSHIRAQCTAQKARGGLGLVLVDYLGLVKGEGKNRYEQLHDVAYGLKAMAKDLQVPVIALAQLNRDVERRDPDKQRPRMSDLRDSGGIEEAADVIGMLFRQGYYDEQFSMPGVLECNLVKNRNADTGQCLWHFAGDYSRITMLDEHAVRQYRHLQSEIRIASRRRASADL